MIEVEGIAKSVLAVEWRGRIGYDRDPRPYQTGPWAVSRRPEWALSARRTLDRGEGCSSRGVPQLRRSR
jgi:hypothetical protein